jgi:hypothetical protein
MLKDYTTTNMGIKLRRKINESAQNGVVRKYSPNNNYSFTIPRSDLYAYPIQNNSQVLKSHLSKDRFGKVGVTQLKTVNFVKSLSVLKLIHTRLCYEMIEDEYVKDGVFIKDQIKSKVNLKTFKDFGKDTSRHCK